MLIGIHGKAGVGKDLAAAILIGAYGGKRFAFADPLRTIAAAMFDLDPMDFDTQEKKAIVDDRWNMSRRWMLQFVGTELVRQQLSDRHWIKLLHLRRQRLPSRVINHFITDCRFANEIDYVLDQGGFILHIASDSRNAIKYGSSEAAHASESELDMTRAKEYNRYSYIQNDGTMARYRMDVIDAYDAFFKREAEMKKE